MKRVLTSIGVFMLIICVDSLIKMENTIPQQNSFPALILRTHYLVHRPLVPHSVIENSNTNTKKFKYETVEKGFNILQNHSVSYQCPVGKGTLELEKSNAAQCENELQVAIFENGKKCGNENRKEYNIGYGTGEESSTGFLKTHFTPDDQNSQENKVRWPLCTSCFDEGEQRVYAVKYELRSRNDLYRQSSTIYPAELNKKISDLDSNFHTIMMKKLHHFQNKTGKKIIERKDLIPFQLVSHEDMILYNLKLVTFNEKNYSYIFSNVADNSWKQINIYLRNFMKKCNYDLELYSGVHDYTDEGYPRYIWKFLSHRESGIAVVIHNQSIDDKQNYPRLCPADGVNCEGYGLLADEIHTEEGVSYCCSPYFLKDKIPFIKDNFPKFKVEGLHLSELVSVDDGADPQPFEYVNNPQTTNSSSEPTSSNSRKYVQSAAPYNTPFRRFRTPKAQQSDQPEPSKSSAPNEDDDVKKLQDKLAMWSPLHPKNQPPS